MRDAFFSELRDLYAADKRIVFVTGDLGYKLFDSLREVDPDRMINFGVRESAMVGFCAGLARTGMLPFAYSIVPFMTLRCLEQIKLDLCYNHCRVVLVGVGGGFAYGPNGPTHHGIDDIGALSCFPGMRVWTPADPQEVRACVRNAPNLDGPAYLRLGRNGEPAIHTAPPDIIEPMDMRHGADGVMISYGVILHETLKACDLLVADGIRPRVIHLPAFRPFPTEFIAKALAGGAPVMTIEEHVSAGGLGQEVAVCIAESGGGGRFRRLCVPGMFPESCMSREASLVWAGIDAVSVAREYKALLTGSATSRVKANRDNHV